MKRKILTIFRLMEGWGAPLAFVALGLIPTAAGIARLVQLAGGEGPKTSDDVRFFAAPLPVVAHVLSSIIYSTFGAFQFTARLRRPRTNWHRAAGQILVFFGICTALSGFWMTLYYPKANFDGQSVFVMRLLVSVLIIFSIGNGVAAIKRGDVNSHRAWMMRGYALSLGAGTQVFTHLPWLLFPDIRGELTRSLCMGMGWIINLVIAELVIAHGFGNKTLS